MGAGWLTVGNFLLRSFRRADLRRPCARDERNLRLVEPASRPPMTSIERLAVAALEREGSMGMDRLVRQVAAELYREALQKGAGLVDLGLFGADLFVFEVIRELDLADGVLWKIEPAIGAR